jgi:hypothetical protein
MVLIETSDRSIEISWQLYIVGDIRSEGRDGIDKTNVMSEPAKVLV